MGLLSRILRWLDRSRAVADVQQFARRRGLTPIEIAAVSRLVRMHHDTHGNAERAIVAGRDCVIRLSLRRPDNRPLTGVVIHLPRGRIGGAR